MSKRLVLLYLLFSSLYSLGQSSAPLDKMGQVDNAFQKNPTAIISADSILQKMALYKNVHPSGILYVHFDKTVYTNNEDIWFTVYLLNCPSPEKHTTLSVALINDVDRKIAMEELFLINDGLSFGHLTLPDTIAPGNYHLLVYSNVLDKAGKPADVFSQPLTVKTTRSSGFSASVKLVDTIRDSHGNLTAIVRVDSKNINIKPSADIEYSFGKKTNKAKTNPFGEYAINIPAEAGNLLRITVRKGTDLQFLNLHLPVFRGLPRIRFFPEGGNMIANIDNIIGWEARSSTGEYLKMTGVLYQNNRAIDTIETNYYGIGKFKLSPQKNSSYSFKIVKSGSFAGIKDTVYNLPQALPAGPVMHVVNVLAGDTLTLQLKSTNKQKVSLVLHNFKNIIAYKELKTEPVGYQVKFVLTEAPKGLATITLLDSIGRPLAERLFFAHYRQQESISLQTDKSEYSTREKVNLKLHLNSLEGGGMVSIACVQENRVENDKQTDITTYTYLKHDLQELPADPLGKNYDNPEYIKDILLVKGWRRYTWADMVNTAARDTINGYPSATFSGVITKTEKPLKKSTTLTLIGGRNIRSINTGGTGTFEIPENNLLTEPGKKVMLMVADKYPELFEIAYTNPYKKRNQNLADNISIDQAKLARETNTNSQTIPGFEKAIALREVVIKDKTTDNIYGIKWHADEGTCDDYVCLYNFLNCSAHKKGYTGTTIPIIGTTYSSERYGNIVYKGCILSKKAAEPKYKISIAGINLPKEFYPIDSTMVTAPEPQYVSTIYWNYGVKLKPNEDVNLSFYTGDITGRFRIIVQGAGENDVFTNQLNFTVKKKVDP